MDNQALRGRSILLVEEDPHIACRLADRFRQAGATVFAAGRMEDARYLAEHPALSAAVINLRIGGDTTAGVCRRLSHLGVPFMFHTRYDPSEVSERWPEAPVVSKPADSAEVMRAVVTLVH